MSWRSPPHKRNARNWQGQTVGLFGGSFNPAHNGHIHISQCALRSLGLDAVWWMVSPQNPLKSSEGMASQATRIRRAKRLTRHHPKFIVTDIEKQLGTRYTAQTLKKLQKRFPKTRFIWLMGADLLQQIHRWQRWEEIFYTCPIAVFDRPPYSLNALMGKASLRFKNFRFSPKRAIIIKSKNTPCWSFKTMPRMAVSATALRQATGNAGWFSETGLHTALDSFDKEPVF